MKKTVSVVYTVFVVAALLCVIAFFGWKTYQSRALRISDFVARTDEYTLDLSKTLAENRDVDTEVAVAEKFMEENPSLIAVQVYSHDDGLRLSVVKSTAGDFARKPIAGSDRFDSFPARIRYHKITKPMHVADMQGLEATYISATLSGAEIRNNLMIILITVVGLFAITLVLILVKPKESFGESDNKDEDDSLSDSNDNDDFSLPDFDPANTLDENDLFGSGPEISDSLSMDDDFSLPELDDFSDNPAAVPPPLPESPSTRPTARPRTWRGTAVAAPETTSTATAPATTGSAGRASAAIAVGGSGSQTSPRRCQSVTAESAHQARRTAR